MKIAGIGVFRSQSTPVMSPDSVWLRVNTSELLAAIHFCVRCVTLSRNTPPSIAPASKTCRRGGTESMSGGGSHASVFAGLPAHRCANTSLGLCLLVIVSSSTIRWPTSGGDVCLLLDHDGLLYREMLGVRSMGASTSA